MLAVWRVSRVFLYILVRCCIQDESRVHKPITWLVSTDCPRIMMIHLSCDLTACDDRCLIKLEVCSLMHSSWASSSLFPLPRQERRCRSNDSVRRHNCAVDDLRHLIICILGHLRKLEGSATTPRWISRRMRSSRVSRLQKIRVVALWIHAHSWKPSWLAKIRSPDVEIGRPTGARDGPSALPRAAEASVILWHHLLNWKEHGGSARIWASPYGSHPDLTK